jgi:hypothetical protein
MWSQESQKTCPPSITASGRPSSQMYSRIIAPV